jgi:hypothetical protein
VPLIWWRASSSRPISTSAIAYNAPAAASYRRLRADRA